MYACPTFMLNLMYDYQEISFYGSATSVLCQPVGWPVKYHTKKCLYSQNNMVGHMTYAAAAADMPARLMLAVMYIPVCLFFFDYLSRPSFEDFAAL